MHSLLRKILDPPLLMYKAPAKRSQHFNTTCPDIVSSVVASFGQAIATSECNICQHCWAQCMLHAFGHPVTTCCDMLGIENRTSVHARVQHCCTKPGQTTTTSCKIHKCCVKNLTIFKFEPTTPNTSQHVATGWPNGRNMLQPKMLRNVALPFDRLAGAYDGTKRSTIVISKGNNLIVSQL